MGIKFIFQWIAYAIELVKGPGLIHEITRDYNHIEALDAHSIYGYTATIHCQERQYRRSYTRWFIPDKHIYAYFVFTTISGTAPPVLVEAASMTRYFPRLLHAWSGSKRQKQAAIEAYVDLLVSTLERGKVNSP